MDGLSSLSPDSLLFEALRRVEHCWKMDADLQQWHEELEHQNPGLLYWPEFAKLDNASDDPEQGKLFPVAFHFSSLRAAHISILYWTTLIVLWSGLTRLYRNISVILEKGTPGSHDGFVHFNSAHWSANNFCSCEDPSPMICHKHFRMRKLPPLEHRADWPQYIASNICQSVEYCIQDEMMGLGPAAVSPSLVLVADRLRKEPGYWSRQLLWIEAVLARTYGRGIRVMKYFDRT